MKGKGDRMKIRHSGHRGHSSEGMGLLFSTDYKSRRGFTLTELIVLVVTGLMFSALLLPALSRAQDENDNVVCKDNHRRLVQAALSYVNDYDTIFNSTAGRAVTYPALLSSAHSKLGWGVTEYSTDGTEYLEVRDRAFFCPTLNTPEQIAAQKGGGWVYAVHAMNAALEGAAVSQERIAQGNVFVMNPSRVRVPENYWFFTESYNANAKTAWFQLEGYMIRGVHPNLAVHLRHNGRTNMSFLDGHVDEVGIERLKGVDPVPFVAGYDENFERIDF